MPYKFVKKNSKFCCQKSVNEVGGRELLFSLDWKMSNEALKGGERLKRVYFNNSSVLK